ncbi:DUF423 domain-containing protein [Oceanibaculum pacificum]|uniref:DUF423 domain-containing protein n=1 Tax=Oceanibaculum pacificum TaxID=580166 RepID=A0A154W3R5_9PROT|nr:DUF423 domain-containing protein [Oceanibaculum pacificum]KZD08188.1 hypothetical protein AUP43_08810 [Oceanibaculum pacificum]
MRIWLIAAGLNGALLVVLGALGAHGFSGDEYARSLFDTAWRYQGLHVLAMLAVALALPVFAGRARIAALAALALFALGSVLFSGSLYRMAWTGEGLFGGAAPLGGGALILGWLVVALAGGLHRPPPAA